MTASSTCRRMPRSFWIRPHPSPSHGAGSTKNPSARPQRSVGPGPPTPGIRTATSKAPTTNTVPTTTVRGPGQSLARFPGRQIREVVPLHKPLRPGSTKHPVVPAAAKRRAGTSHPRHLHGRSPSVRHLGVMALRLRQSSIEILPVRILCLDQVQLPLTAPTLELFFPLNGCCKVGAMLEVNQSSQTVLLGEPGHIPQSMFPDPSQEIVCHADIQRAAEAIGQDIDVAIPAHCTNSEPRVALEQWELGAFHRRKMT